MMNPTFDGITYKFIKRDRLLKFGYVVKDFYDACGDISAKIGNILTEEEKKKILEAFNSAENLLKLIKDKYIY